MITNRAEAFAHNSCKKVAQLVKVITFMSDQSRELKELLDEQINGYEEDLRIMADNYQQDLANKNAELTKFRKAFIDRACRDFGSKYKDIKTQYTNTIKDRSSEINTIVQESRKMRKQIIELETILTENANNVTKSADFFFAGMKKLNSKETIEAFIRANPEIKDILTKCAQLSKKHEKDTKKAKEKHIADKRDLETQINILLKEEYKKRNSTFQAFKSRVKILKNETITLRANLDEIVKYKQKFTKTNYDKRDKLVSETTKQVKRLDLQSAACRNQIESENKKHITNINSIAKQKAQNIENFNKTLEQIQTLIDKQRKATEQMKLNRTSDIQKQNAALQSIAESLKLKLTSERKQKIETIKDNEKSIENQHKKLEEMKTVMQNHANNENQLIEQKIVKLNETINKSYERVKAAYDIEKQKFTKQAEERFSAMQGRAAVERESSEKIIKKFKSENEAKSSEIAKQKSLVKTEEEKVIKLNQQKIIEYEKNLQQRQKKRQVELDSAKNRKIGENSKKLTNVQSTFSKDLNEKKAKINENINKKLSEPQEELNCSKEEKDHQQEILRMNGRLELGQKVVNECKAASEKTLENLNNLVNSTEKSLRTFQRQMKTETHEIDEEFEMKIQVEQVSLLQKIENISKLYTKEENQRGVEIIEAIRKVHQLQNRTKDILTKKRNSINDMKRKRDLEITKQKEKINRLKNGEEEKLLKKKLSDLELENNNIIKEFETQRDKEISDKKHEIERMNESINKEKDLILEKAKAESTEFNNQKSEIERMITQTKESIQPQKDRIIEETESKKAEMRKDHDLEVSKLKHRIETLKEQSKESAQAKRDEEVKYAKSIVEDLTKKGASGQKSLDKVGKESDKKCGGVIEQTLSIEKEYSRLLADQAGRQMRTEDAALVKEYQSKLKEESAAIRDAFGQFCAFLSGDRPRTASSLQGPPTSRSSSRRLGKSDSTSAVGVLKSKGPSLVTPHV